MSNIYCTLAIGKTHADFAQFLAADLENYKVPLVIVTNEPGFFRGYRHAHVVEHYPPYWCFHDKRLALKEALKLGETAVFVDADTAVWFGADRRTVREALAYEFPPGLHAARLHPAGEYDYPHHEERARQWGFQFDRNVIAYWEALFALTRDENTDKFFACWEKFADYSKEHNDQGVGEGTCFGIAAEASGLRKHYTTHMVKSSLPFLLWHTRLGFKNRRLHHLKYGIKQALQGNINVHHHCWAR
jgi:hypothetical protein